MITHFAESTREEAAIVFGLASIPVEPTVECDTLHPRRLSGDVRVKG
jgi:hypothetical protein